MLRKKWANEMRCQLPHLICSFVISSHFFRNTSIICRDLKKIESDVDQRDDFSKLRRNPLSRGYLSNKKTLSWGNRRVSGEYLQWRVEIWTLYLLKFCVKTSIFTGTLSKSSRSSSIWVFTSNASKNSQH